jgi:hypothetical protein
MIGGRFLLTNRHAALSSRALSWPCVFKHSNQPIPIINLKEENKFLKLLIQDNLRWYAKYQGQSLNKFVASLFDFGFDVPRLRGGRPQPDRVGQDLCFLTRKYQIIQIYLSDSSGWRGQIETLVPLNTPPETIHLRHKHCRTTQNEHTCEIPSCVQCKHLFW